MATEYKRQQRRQGTAAQWSSANPVLLAGEDGYESDTGKVKIGDGTTAWNSLGYWGTGPDVTLSASLTDVLGLTGQALSAVDAGADRIIFWDDSANKTTYLQVSTGLQITGTVLTVDSTIATLSGAQTLTNKTLGDVKEGTYTITDGPSVDLNPANGPLQKWVLGTNRSPTATSFGNGQSMKLKIGGNYVITYPSVVWTGTANGSSGSPPNAPTSGFLHVQLWKEDNVLYGAFVGYTAT